MGRNRKPTDALERSGALKKNPKRGRERANEPVILDPLGPPPADFPFMPEWSELREECKEVLLTRADRSHFEMTVRLKVRCRSVDARTGDFAQLQTYLGKLGLNPADRSRVHGVDAARRSAQDTDEDWIALAEEGSSAPIQ